MRTMMSALAVSILSAACSASPVSPSAIGSGTAEDSHTPSPSLHATVNPTEPGPGDLEAVATLGWDGALQEAADVVATSSGLIAVGTHYATVVLPVFGPVPQEGRVWRSADGRSWDDVTPPDAFADAALRRVYQTGDGGLIVIGSKHDDPETPEERQFIWKSPDGMTWASTQLEGLTGNIQDVAHGPNGYLAIVYPDGGGSTLVFSTDGLRWRLSLAAQAGTAWLDVDAGPEGFVAIGVWIEGYGSPPIVASSNGSEWFDAASPPTVDHVASHGNDWVAVSSGPEVTASDTETPIWYSENGLDWAERGGLPLKAFPLPGGGTCREFVSRLISAAGQLVASTGLSYPCAEGRVIGAGSQLISSDGESWTPLPLGDVKPGERGSAVAAMIAVDDRIVLVGRTATEAAFWLLGSN